MIKAFTLEKIGYQGLQRAMKAVAGTMPFPKPTLFMGPDSSLELCDAIAQLDETKILIVTDKTLVEIGLLKKIEERLSANGVNYSIFDGVKPDPTFDQIEAASAQLDAQRCEAVLAVGGGSAIDCAKVVCAVATNKKSLRKLSGMFRVFKAPLPLFAVPTTAGTGSEVTLAAVISDPETHKKFSILDPKLTPLMAALDGALMTGLPPGITAATGMDALTHAIEAYISRNAFADTDAHALAATRLIMDNLPAAFADGSDVATRQQLAQASYYAGLAFTKAGVGYVHAIAHALGGRYHTPHGLANAIVLPHLLDYTRDAVVPRLAKLAEVSGLGGEHDHEEQLADAFIAHVREMAGSFDIPETLDALREQDIPSLARAALKEAHLTYAVPKYMDQKTCETLIGQMLPR